MQEIVFLEQSAYGENTINDLTKASTLTVGDVSISFSADGAGLNNEPSYNYNGSNPGIVTLSRNNQMKVSVPSGKQIIQINLYFDTTDSSSLSISAASSPVGGGGFTDGNATKDAIWKIDSYSGGVFTPSANQVTFSTEYAWKNARKLYGLSVTYK
ncbi:MAG: hypothetical protein IJ795_04475 [Bacteroidales bacterium]|nr:hypothetical protein [Bacteroidales bacterium]